MATTGTQETAIVLRVPTEILGPGSVYESRRLARIKEFAPILAAVEALKVIASQEDKEQAVKLGQLLLVESKERTALFKSVKTQIDDIKKPILADEHKDVDPLDAQKKRLEGLCVTYNQEQKRLKDEADRKANEAIQKQALEDAERRRNELLDFAAEVELSGKKEQAENLMEEAVSVEPEYVPPVVTQAAPKTQGEVEKFTYSMTVVNRNELIQAALDGKAVEQCIIINESYLNSKARLDKEGFHVPGCRLNRTPKVNFRS